MFSEQKVAAEAVKTRRSDEELPDSCHFVNGDWRERPETKKIRWEITLIVSLSPLNIYKIA